MHDMSDVTVLYGLIMHSDDVTVAEKYFWMLELIVSISMI